MERLVLFFVDSNADTMSTYSHSSKLPWKKVYGKGEGEGHMIPYNMALQAEPIVVEHPSIAEEDIRMLDEIFQGTGLR